MNSFAANHDLPPSCAGVRVSYSRAAGSTSRTWRMAILTNVRANIQLRSWLRPELHLPGGAAQTRTVSVGELGWIPANLCELSKEELATTFLSSSATQSGLRELTCELGP